MHTHGAQDENYVRPRTAIHPTKPIRFLRIRTTLKCPKQLRPPTRCARGSWYPMAVVGCTCQDTLASYKYTSPLAATTAALPMGGVFRIGRTGNARSGPTPSPLVRLLCILLSPKSGIFGIYQQSRQHAAKHDKNQVKKCTTGTHANLFRVGEKENLISESPPATPPHSHFLGVDPGHELPQAAGRPPRPDGPAPDAAGP